MFELAEGHVSTYVEWLRLVVESLGALVIAAGIVVVLIGLVRQVLKGGGGFVAIRLAFARHLTLALELQLGADILSTSIAPTWDRIGKLAAIAVIRTVLNYFLTKELRDERASEAPAPGGSGQGGPP